MKNPNNTPFTHSTVSLLIPFLLLMAACANPGNQSTRLETLPMGSAPKALAFSADAVPLPVIIEFPASVDPSATTAWQNYYRNELIHNFGARSNAELGADEVLTKSSYFAMELYEAIQSQLPERTVLLNPTTITTGGSTGLQQVSEYSLPPARVVVHVSAFVAGSRVSGEGLFPRDTYGKQLFPNIYLEVINPGMSGYKRVPIGTLPRYSDSQTPFVRITEPSAISINNGRGQAISGWFSPNQSFAARPWQGFDKYFLLPMNIETTYEAFEGWKNKQYGASSPFERYWQYVAFTLQDLLANLPAPDMSLAANQYLETLNLKAASLSPKLIETLNSMQRAEIQILSDQDRLFMQQSYHGTWGDEFRHYIAMESEAHKDETDARRAANTAGFMNQIGTIAAAGVMGSAGGSSSTQQIAMQMTQFQLREQQISQMYQSSRQIGQIFQQHFSGVMRNQGDFIVKIGSEESEIRVSSLAEMRNRFRSFLTGNFNNVSAI
jgi:hypothetical protein